MEKTMKQLEDMMLREISEIIPYPNPSRSDKEGKPRISRIPENINKRVLKIINNECS